MSAQKRIAKVGEGVGEELEGVGMNSMFRLARFWRIEREVRSV